jgi:hemin uptake protein HemP
MFIRGINRRGPCDFARGVLRKRQPNRADTTALQTVRSLELVYLQNIDVDALFAVPLEKMQRGIQEIFWGAVSEKSNRNDQPNTPPSAEKTPRTISSRELMGGARLLIIRHEREDYRLQVTATGKLILTK